MFIQLRDYNTVVKLEVRNAASTDVKWHQESSETKKEVSYERKVLGSITNKDGEWILRRNKEYCPKIRMRSAKGELPSVDIQRE